MATVKASATSVPWGARVTFSGEGWQPGRPVTITSTAHSERKTRGRPDGKLAGKFDVTLALAPVNSKDKPVKHPVTLTFDDGEGNTADVTVKLT